MAISVVDLRAKFERKRVLVAGAGGFLGQHLVRSLVGLGAEVYGVSRRSEPEMNAATLHWQLVDLCNPDAATEVLGKVNPQIVYQLCSTATGVRDINLVRPTLENDLLTTVNLLIASKQIPIERFVATDSLEVGSNEETPVSPYAAAKLASTSYVRLFQNSFGLPSVLLRIYMTYGPGQPQEKVIPYVIRQLLAGEAPRLYSPDRLVDWIYVDDVIRGFLLSGVASDIEGLTIDLGSGQLKSIRDVVDKLIRISGVQVVSLSDCPQPSRPERVRVANLELARRKLQWEPQISLDKGLRMTLDAWR